MEEERKRVLRKQHIAGLLLALLWIAIFYLASQYLRINGGEFLGGALFVYLLYLYVCAVLAGDYVTDYKTNVIRPLVYRLDPNLTYECHRRIPKETFLASKLYDSMSKLFDDAHYSGDDYVSGIILGIPVEFSELEFVHINTTPDHTEKTTIFEGIFFVCEFNKSVDHDIFIHTGDSDAWMFAKNLVRLDNPEFGKNFTVFCEDPITAHYVLTHTMMERLLQFKRKMGVPIDASIIGSKFYLGLKYGKKALFEADVEKSLFDDSDIRFYTEILTGVYEIVGDFRLSEYLWSKKERLQQLSGDIT